jgi:hypothetical protein
VVEVKVLLYLLLICKYNFCTEEVEEWWRWGFIFASN